MNYAKLSPKPISGYRLLRIVLVDPDINFVNDGWSSFMASPGKT